jgi:hypothetical protein
VAKGKAESEIMIRTLVIALSRVKRKLTLPPKNPSDRSKQDKTKYRRSENQKPVVIIQESRLARRQQERKRANHPKSGYQRPGPEEIVSPVHNYALIGQNAGYCA